METYSSQARALAARVLGAAGGRANRGKPKSRQHAAKLRAILARNNELRRARAEARRGGQET